MTARCSGVLIRVSSALGLAWYAIISVIDGTCPSHAAKWSAYICTDR